MARSIDIQRLIGEVAARDGIRVEPGDPAFALVTLNQLVLEDAIKQIEQHIRSGIAEFTEAVKKTESRAGKVLAQEVKEAAAHVREELHRDVEAARVGATQILYDVRRGTTRASLMRWGAAGAAAAATLLAAGIWIGCQFVR